MSNQRLLGKIFYRKDPKDSNRFQTIRFGWNMLANKVVAQHSNWVYGTPPPEIKEINPHMLRGLNRLQVDDAPITDGM